MAVVAQQASAPPNRPDVEVVGRRRRRWWPGRVVRIGLVLFALLVAYVGITFVQVWMASGSDDARPAEAIIVLGAAQYDGEPSPVLAARLDHAAELYRRG